MHLTRSSLALIVLFFVVPALADDPPVYGPFPEPPPAAPPVTAEKRDWLIVRGQSALIECAGGSPTVHSRQGRVLDQLPEIGNGLYKMDGRAASGDLLASGRYTVLCPDGARHTIIWVK